MKHYISLIILVLYFLDSQSQIVSKLNQVSCRFEMVRLDFDSNLKLGESDSNIKLLHKGTITTDTLFKNSDISDVIVKTDTVCCWYGGYYYLTSLVFLLKDSLSNRLASIQPPLCCGIPVIILANGSELLRAYYWNSLSSFGSNEFVLTFNGGSLVVANQFPTIPDIRNHLLLNILKSHDCIPKNAYTSR